MNLVFINNTPILSHHINLLQKRYSYIKTFNTSPPSNEEVIKRAQNSEVIVSNWYPLNENVLSKLDKLKYICITSTHSEYIDINYAHKKGVIVSNIKDYCIEAVAQHTLGLILDASKKISFSYSELTTENLWQPKKFRGIELFGKTLGIIGYGKIGSLVAKTLEAGFGMKVLKYNSKSSKSYLNNIFKESDVISINLPLTHLTKNLITFEQLSQLKQKALIINTGKAGVIDKTDLLTTLDSKDIIYATDVFHEEPLSDNDPLLNHNKCLITPHCAWNTVETSNRISKEIYRNLLAFSKNEPVNMCLPKNDQTDSQIAKSYSSFLHN